MAKDLETTIFEDRKLFLSMCWFCFSAKPAIAIVGEKFGLSRLKRSITAFA